MRRLPRLEYERKSGPIRYTIFRQSPYVGTLKTNLDTRTRFSLHSRLSITDVIGSWRDILRPVRASRMFQGVLEIPLRPGDKVLFDHLRDQIQAFFGHRRDMLKQVPLVGFGGLVWAQPLHLI